MKVGDRFQESNGKWYVVTKASEDGNNIIYEEMYPQPKPIDWSKIPSEQVYRIGVERGKQHGKNEGTNQGTIQS